MILGAEIGMLIWGIIAMVTGKLTLSKTKIVYGTPARLLGIIGILPLPLAFAIGFMFGAYIGVSQGPMDAAQFQRRYGGIFLAIELGVLIFCLVLLYGLGFWLADDVDKPKPRRRSRDDDNDFDDEEEGAPRRRRRRDVEEDDDRDDDRPRRSKPIDDELDAAFEPVEKPRTPAASVPSPIQPKPAPAAAPAAGPPSTVSCSCGTMLKVTPALAGKKVRCPKCQAVVFVPTRL